MPRRKDQDDPAKNESGVETYEIRSVAERLTIVEQRLKALKALLGEERRRYGTGTTH